MNWKDYCINQKEKLKRKFLSSNIDNPVTFTDKLNYLKIYDSSLLKSFCADKINLRNYCKQKLGKNICIPILAIYDYPEEIDWNSLPNKFVIKCNHGSGFNIIVKDKNNIDKENCIKTLKKWMATDYGDISFELFYNLIDKKVFIEEYKCLNDKSLGDYKFWCFNGIPRFFTINFNFGHGNINHYDLNGNLLDIERKDFPKNRNRKDKIPNSLPLMIEYSKKLSEDFKFVRVDFYEIDEIPFLGELTFIPGGGKLHYKDPNTNLILGNFLKL